MIRLWRTVVTAILLSTTVRGDDRHSTAACRVRRTITTTATVGHLFAYEIPGAARPKIFTLVKQAENYHDHHWLFYDTSSSCVYGVPYPENIGLTTFLIRSHINSTCHMSTEVEVAVRLRVTRDADDIVTRESCPNGRTHVRLDLDKEIDAMGRVSLVRRLTSFLSLAPGIVSLLPTQDAPAAILAAGPGNIVGRKAKAALFWRVFCHKENAVEDLIRSLEHLISSGRLVQELWTDILQWYIISDTGVYRRRRNVIAMVTPISTRTPPSSNTLINRHLLSTFKMVPDLTTMVELSSESHNSGSWFTGAALSDPLHSLPASDTNMVAPTGSYGPTVNLGSPDSGLTSWPKLYQKSEIFTKNSPHITTDFLTPTNDASISIALSSDRLSDSPSDPPVSGSVRYSNKEVLASDETGTESRRFDDSSENDGRYQDTSSIELSVLPFDRGTLAHSSDVSSEGRPYSSDPRSNFDQNSDWSFGEDRLPHRYRPWSNEYPKSSEHFTDGSESLPQSMLSSEFPWSSSSAQSEWNAVTDSGDQYNRYSDTYYSSCTNPSHLTNPPNYASTESYPTWHSNFHKNSAAQSKWSSDVDSTWPSETDSRSAWPSDTDSRSAWPSDTDSRSAWPSDTDSRSAWPSDTDSRSAWPSDADSRSAWPSDTDSRSSWPSDTDSRSTWPIDTDSRSAWPSDTETYHSWPKDSDAHTNRLVDADSDSSLLTDWESPSTWPSETESSWIVPTLEPIIADREDSRTFSKSRTSLSSNVFNTAHLLSANTDVDTFPVSEISEALGTSLAATTTGSSPVNLTNDQLADSVTFDVTAEPSHADSVSLSSGQSSPSAETLQHLLSSDPQITSGGSRAVIVNTNSEPTVLTTSSDVTSGIVAHVTSFTHGRSASIDAESTLSGIDSTLSVASTSLTLPFQQSTLSVDHRTEDVTNESTLLSSVATSDANLITSDSDQLTPVTSRLTSSANTYTWTPSLVNSGSVSSTTVTVPTAPQVGRPLDIVYTPYRRFFSLPIPLDTLYDAAGGRQLQYSLLDGNMRAVHANSSWIFVDEGTNTLRGIVVNDSVAARPHQFILVARNSRQMAAYDPFIVVVNRTESFVPGTETHYIDAVFDLNYESFVNNTTAIIDLLTKISSYFISEPEALSVEFHRGSVVLRWTNLTVKHCDEATALRAMLMYANSTPKSEFVLALTEAYPLRNVTFRFAGQCVALAVTTVDGSAWPVAVLALVTVVLLIVAVILVWYLYRRREKRVTGEIVLNDSGSYSLFKNDRMPVILPGDNELSSVRVSRMRNLRTMSFVNGVLSQDEDENTNVGPGPGVSAPKYTQRHLLQVEVENPSPPPNYSSKTPPVVPIYRTPPPYFHKTQNI